ncbi:MAG: hypothetical protein ACI3T9_04545 [Romboutsia timonensis]
MTAVAITSMVLLGAFMITLTRVIDEWEPKQKSTFKSKYYKDGDDE